MELRKKANIFKISSNFFLTRPENSSVCPTSSTCGIACGLKLVAAKKRWQIDVSPNRTRYAKEVKITAHLATCSTLSTLQTISTGQQMTRRPWLRFGPGSCEVVIHRSVLLIRRITIYIFLNMWPRGTTTFWVYV